jgi:endonuclease/exonuclease/phosphatase family metal-dependent hydrolase
MAFQHSTRSFLLAGIGAAALLAASSAPRRPSATVRLLSWNVEHGGPRGAAAQVRFINRLSPPPDAIVLQEVNEDAIGRYVRGIRTRAGHSWHVVAAPHCQVWIGSDPSGSCESPRPEHVLVMTTLPVLDEGRTLLYGPDDYMDARAAAFVETQVNGHPLFIVGTHLAAGQTADMDAVRTTQVQLLKRWVDGLGEGVKVVGGDFNTRGEQQPEPAAYQAMRAEFVDTWNALHAEEGARSISYTFSADAPRAVLDRRLDYWFVRERGVARPVAVAPARFGNEPPLSDHLPLVATVAIAPPGGSSFPGSDDEAVAQDQVSRR